MDTIATRAHSVSNGMKKLFGLGKGLGSLIPEKSELRITPKKSEESVFYIETNKIKPNPEQPRKEFNGEGLKELAGSIKKFGILQPILVTKIEKQTSHGIDFEYSILAGERRWRAARILNMAHVPAIIKKSLDEDKIRLEVALIENLQREDLNPLEEAFAYHRFAKEFGLTQKDIAAKVSKSREVVANSIRLLDLSSDIQESIRAGKISKTQARALLAFKDESRQKEIYRNMISGMISVREAEKEAKEIKNSPNKSKDNKFQDLERNLSQTIGAPVLIKSGTSGGKVMIKFTNLEELNTIAKKILD